MVNAFDYIIKNGGIDTEKSYPYKGHVSAMICQVCQTTDNIDYVNGIGNRSREP